MATPEKTRPTEPATPSKKKTTRMRLPRLAIPMAGLLVLAAICGYGLYRPEKPSTAPRFPVPAFESHVFYGTEAKVKELDRHIYDALLALGVPAEAVVFSTVQNRRADDDQWTYSDMEIRLPERTPAERVEAAFSRSLSEHMPEHSLMFTSGPQDQTVVEISVHGHPTHRIAFVTIIEELAPSPQELALPLVAIIIDDLGYDEDMASKFLELDDVLTFSVLPHSPFQSQIATAIHESGREVLLHLPMEPLDYPNVNPGKGALMSSMSSEALFSELEHDLAAVPFIVGVNNHMGSRLTQDAEKMSEIFSVLKDRELFFIDSVTSPMSRCHAAAKRTNLKFAYRHVFLDHVQEPNAIRFQIKRLLTFAKTHGRAIGIGHPYPVTLTILQEELPRIREQFDFVPVSQLMG